MFHGHCTTRNWFVHILDKSSFFVEETLFPVHNVWIWTQFDHLAVPRGLISRVHRALTITETLLLGVCFIFLMCIHTEVECSIALTKLNTTVLETHQRTFWMLVMETSLLFNDAWHCFQLYQAAAHLGSRSFVQRDANNTETVLFNMCFAFLLYGHEAFFTMCFSFPLHWANRCTFWTSCTGVSRKCPFLCILPNFGYSFLTEMRILVGQVLHTGGEIGLKMSYIRCFWFSFCQGYMVSKRRHYSVGGNALHLFLGHYSTRDWVVHILDKSSFCVRKTLFPVHNAWICAQFHHLAPLLVSGQKYTHAQGTV